MKHKILKFHLSEAEKKYYEKNNPGWKVKTSDCLLVTFDDGSSTTYAIFEGPWTKSNMCRDCGSYYEVSIGNKIIRIPHPKWEFAGIYADDGISGTNTKNREEFNRMIEDCEAGTIDMIITKSISRFARNTLDCLKYIRQLKEKNIPVFFEKEAINTMDAKGEVLLTIMASLAQQESQSLSQNVKLGLQFRYQNGQVQVNHNRFLGYTKDEEGNLVIDPEQAEVVKRIYREYLEGYSMDKIAAGLEADGILTGAGKPRWHTSTVELKSGLKVDVER